MGRKEIDAVNRRFMTALEAGDGHAVAAVYASDGQLLPPGSETVRGRDGIEAFWKAGIAMGIKSAKLETLELDVRDDLAVEIGRYTLAIEPEGAERITDNGKFVVVHRRGPDGAWEWAVDIFNSDRPAS